MPDTAALADLDKLTWLASDEGPLGLFSPASRAAIARAVGELERLRAERDELRAKVARLDRDTSLVMCSRCNNGFRARDMADGMCAGCLRKERDEARAALDSDAATTRAAGEALAKVESLEAERDAVARLHIWRQPGDDHPVVRLPWRKGGYAGGEYDTFERCYHFGDDASAIEAIRAAGRLAPPDRPRPEGGPTMTTPESAVDPNAEDRAKIPWDNVAARCREVAKEMRDSDLPGVAGWLVRTLLVDAADEIERLDALRGLMLDELLKVETTSDGVITECCMVCHRSCMITRAFIHAPDCTLARAIALAITKARGIDPASIRPQSEEKASDA